jgi:hypothetical protein
VRGRSLLFVFSGSPSDLSLHGVRVGRKHRDVFQGANNMTDTGETFAQKQMRVHQESECRRLADLLKSKIRAGLGFTLFLYDYGKGSMSYVSTGQREDMMVLVAEWLAHADPKFREWYEMKRIERGE